MVSAHFVTPAKAEVQKILKSWIPASGGMTTAATFAGAITVTSGRVLFCHCEE